MKKIVRGNCAKTDGRWTNVGHAVNVGLELFFFGATSGACELRSSIAIFAAYEGRLLVLFSIVLRMERRRCKEVF